jgi:hypothetical protein
VNGQLATPDSATDILKSMSSRSNNGITIGRF